MSRELDGQKFGPNLQLLDVAPELLERRSALGLPEKRLQDQGTGPVIRCALRMDLE